MLNKYTKSLRNAIQETEKPYPRSIEFLINYSKSVECKKLKKKAVFLFQN